MKYKNNVFTICFIVFHSLLLWKQPVYILEITNIQLAKQPQSVVCCVTVSCPYMFHEYVQMEFCMLMPLMNPFNKCAFRTHHEPCAPLGIVLHKLYARWEYKKEPWQTSGCKAKNTFLSTLEFWSVQVVSRRKPLWSFLSYKGMSQIWFLLLSHTVTLGKYFNLIFLFCELEIRISILSVFLTGLIYTYTHTHTLSIFASSNSTIIIVLCVVSCFSPDPMGCNPPSSSVHGILQARVLEWVAMPFSRESSQPRGWTHISCVSYISCISIWVLYHQL